jgi:hypothetical protein
MLTLLSALAGLFVAIFFAARAVRVASRGRAEDANEYRDGDQRDHHQDDQGNDGYAHGLYLFWRV